MIIVQMNDDQLHVITIKQTCYIEQQTNHPAISVGTYTYVYILEAMLSLLDGLGSYPL